MNDQSSARLVDELDAKLARKQDPGIGEILDCIEARVPGAVMRSAAGIQRRSLGFTAGTLR